MRRRSRGQAEILRRLRSMPAARPSAALALQLEGRIRILRQARQSREETRDVHEANARVIEPPVDLFREADPALVVAELPGIEEGDVEIRVTAWQVSITAQRERRRYRVRAVLAFAPARIAYSCRNGVLGIRCE